MVGALLLIFAMAVVMPVGLFLAGAIWSAASGWLLSDDVDRRVVETQASS